jgi:hypothetical protein
MYRCTHPEVIRTRGDGVNPVPVDMEFIRLLNDRYRFVPRESKWNKSPSTFYLTPNYDGIETTMRILDDDTDIMREVIKVSIPIQDRMSELKITNLSEASPEDRARILGIREPATEERIAYTQQKVSVYKWMEQQLWDIGCEHGSQRGNKRTGLIKCKGIVR